jgi:hypothetical protein
MADVHVLNTPIAQAVEELYAVSANDPHFCLDITLAWLDSRTESRWLSTRAD